MAKVDHHLVSTLGDFKAFGSITVDFEFRVTKTRANAIVSFTPGPSNYTMSVMFSMSAVADIYAKTLRSC